MYKQMKLRKRSILFHLFPEDFYGFSQLGLQLFGVSSGLSMSNDTEEPRYTDLRSNPTRL